MLEADPLIKSNWSSCSVTSSNGSKNSNLRIINVSYHVVLALRPLRQVLCCTAHPMSIYAGKVGTQVQVLLPGRRGLNAQLHH